MDCNKENFVRFMFFLATSFSLTHKAVFSYATPSKKDFLSTNSINRVYPVS